MLRHQIQFVVNLTEQGVGAEARRGIGRDDGFNIPRVRGKFVVAARSKITVVKNPPAARGCPDERASD